MAKKSVVNRNEKRKKMVAASSIKRAELKKRAYDLTLTADERYEARIKLQKMPRDTSKVRVRNRCQVTGRSRGVYRKYMVSRIVFREFAHLGYLPGVTKASW